MHFLVMSPCSHKFLLKSLYIYGNIIIVVYLMSAWFKTVNCQLVSHVCIHVHMYTNYSLMYRHTVQLKANVALTHNMLA